MGPHPRFQVADVPGEKRMDTVPCFKGCLVHPRFVCLASCQFGEAAGRSGIARFVEMYKRWVRRLVATSPQR
jgi:hypothetical protein